MKWLVVHHMYVNEMAFDLSDNRNHGIPYAVEQAAAPRAPVLRLTRARQPGSRSDAAKTG